MHAPVGITSTFSVRGEVVHRFQSEPKESADDSSDEQQRKIPDTGVGVDVDGKFDHRYTGRHDHGFLPALKTGGVHGELVQALQDAKADSDAFLTGLIAREQSEENAGLSSEQSSDAAAEKSPELNPAGGLENAAGNAALEGVEASSRHDGKTQPPTPPTVQPAKRPRP